MSSSPAVVTDHHGHAIPTHMTNLIAVPTYDVTKSSIPISSSTRSRTPLFNGSSLWTISSNMPRYITQIAHGIILTVTGKVTCFPTIFARLVIRAVSCNMTLLKAVVAKPQITRRHRRSRAVSCTMPCFPTAVIPTLMATQKQIVQLGMRVLNANRNRFSGSVSLFGSPWNSPQNRFEYRQISQLANGKRACLVDTLALVKSLEAQGVPSKQAEALTSAIIVVLNDSLENVSHSYVTKGDMQKSEMIQESNISKFKSEVQSSQMDNNIKLDQA
nr:protein FMP32, mitochondrial-like [Ipomoea batatas]